MPFWMIALQFLPIATFILQLVFAIMLILDNIELAKRSVLSILILTSVLALGLIVVSLATPVSGILGSLLGVASWVLLFLALSKCGKKGQLFCFIALGIIVLNALITVIQAHSIRAVSITTLPAWAGYVFLAFYVVDKVPGAKPVVAPTANVNRGGANSNMSDIEKLTRLKSLLDSGAILQEEFEAKKRQILGR